MFYCNIFTEFVLTKKNVFIWIAIQQKQSRESIYCVEFYHRYAHLLLKPHFIAQRYAQNTDTEVNLQVSAQWISTFVCLYRMSGPIYTVQGALCEWATVSSLLSLVSLVIAIESPQKERQRMMKLTTLAHNGCPRINYRMSEEKDILEHPPGHPPDLYCSPPHCPRVRLSHAAKLLLSNSLFFSYYFTLAAARIHRFSHNCIIH